MERVNMQLVQETAEKLSLVERGNVIPHLTIENFLGIRRLEPKSKYYALVKRIKTILKCDYGIFLKTEPKIGYRLALPGQEVDLCKGKFLSGIKKTRQAVADGNYIRLDNIKDDATKNRTIQEFQMMANITGLLKQGSEKLLPLSD